MEMIVLMVALFLCMGAAYRWAKQVESIAEASITLEGQSLKRVLNKRKPTDG